MLRYRVLVDDNYHYMDPGERYEQGTYDNVEDALAVCRRLVDLSLKEGYQPGMTAEALFGYYKSFGDDPFIVVLGGSDESAKFSAWNYARDRCRLMCIASAGSDNSRQSK
jgi:hypothetical protein